jgi:hypothetical protein
MNMKSIFFGFESGSPKVLEYLKRGKVTMEENYNAIKLGVQHGMQVFGNVIIGSPVELEEDIKLTIDFINWAWKNGAARITASVLIPYPGTPIWDIAKEMGKVRDDMNFAQLMVDIEGDMMNGIVSGLPPEKFRPLAEDTLRAIHKFKWRKLFRFMHNDFWGTVRFVSKSPWPLIRRMFVRTST